MLNGTERVLPETEKRVRDAIASLDFEPSLLASGLSRGRTYLLGLVVPDIANPFFAELARAVEDTASAAGYGIFVCSTDEKPEREAQYLRLLVRRGVDGLLVCATGSRSIADAWHQWQPVVTLVREVGEGWPLVRTDDLRGGRMAAEHLIALGHRRIAFLAESLRLISTQHRLQGWAQALAERGLACDNAAHVDRVTLDAVGEGIDQLLRRAPTGLCAGTDLLALYAVGYLRAKGFQIPEDISVVGFDNTFIARLVEVPLTTVAQDIPELSTAAVRTMLNLIATDRPDRRPERCVIPPVLVVRKSTGPPGAAI